MKKDGEQSDPWADIKGMRTVKMKLAGSRTGRVILHTICMAMDHKWSWHLNGIIREIKKH